MSDLLDTYITSLGFVLSILGSVVLVIGIVVLILFLFSRSQRHWLYPTTAVILIILIASGLVTIERLKQEQIRERRASNNLPPR